MEPSRRLMAVPDSLIIGEGSEWEVEVVDARRHATWSQNYGSRSGPPSVIFWHHSADNVVPDLDLVGQLNWLTAHIHSGQYGWPYNFLIWSQDDHSTIYYLNDVDSIRAHTYGHNADTAICLHGNWERDVPPQSLIDSAWHLSHALAVMWGTEIPIRPHRAVYATACPGKHVIEALTARNG